MKVEDFRYLDGLRGLAALIVFNGNFWSKFFGWWNPAKLLNYDQLTNKTEVARIHDEIKPDWYNLVVSTPLNLFFYSYG